LVNLWWEWPHEHWEDLRIGVSMNFWPLHRGLVDNMKFSDEEQSSAFAFFNELVSLGAVVPVPDGYQLSKNCYLYPVSKPGQPGQHRYVADMKQGNQNAAIGRDPVHLYQPQDTPPLFFPKGYMAVLDASKYFHMFLTLLRERHLLGVRHPETNKAFWLERLPMGSSRSPAASGRFGAAFVSMVREQCPQFQGLQNDLVLLLQGLDF
jgi:hypothetical protein